MAAIAPNLSRRTALRAALLSLCGLYALCWLLGVIGISRDIAFPTDERWAGSTTLFLEGGLAFLWITYAFDIGRALRFAAVVLPLAFAVEYVGVATGLPFGPYHYTGGLVPAVLGRVPAPITVAWLLIALGSLAAATALLPGRGLATAATLAAVLATALDLCLEPTAVHVKSYWLWERSGWYYGVPSRNFLGWFVAAWTINVLAARVLWRTRSPHLPVFPAIPVTLYWATVAMFATIDCFRGYPGGGAVGVSLALCALAYRLCRRRDERDERRRCVPSIRRTRASATALSSRESREN